MERLTFEGNFCDIARCLEACGGKHCPDGYCSQRKVWERLKAYEETGLTPEEIFGLCEMDKRSRMAQMLRWEEADQDGRLVVLPCKVGDAVWFNTFEKNATVCIGIQPHRVIRFDISAVVPGKYHDTELPMWQFGKSVFLSREAAEAALKGSHDD